MSNSEIKLLINSITLVTQTFDPIGIAFDPLASLINHSCDPNSVMIFNGRSLSVRALKEISKGEEITISYIDNTSPTHKRQGELAERYFFECGCLRCTSGNEIKDPREAFGCLSPGCDGWVSGRVIDQSPGGAHHRKCKKCNATMSLTSQELQQLEDNGWAAVSGATLPGSNKGANLIDTIKILHATKIWPLQHQPLPALHYELVHTVYIPTSSWPRALVHSLILYLLVDPVFYPQRHHPVRVVHAFTLASLLLQVSGDSSSLAQEFPRAKELELDYGKIIWVLLCEIVAHVGMSHGAKSSFAEIVMRKKEEVENDLRASEITKAWVGKRVDEIGLEGELGKIRGLVDGLLEDLRGAKSA